MTVLHSCLKPPQINTRRRWFTYTKWVQFVSTSTRIEVVTMATKSRTVMYWHYGVVIGWTGVMPRSIVLADWILFKSARLCMVGKHLSRVVRSPSSARSWSMLSRYYSCFWWWVLAGNDNTRRNRQGGFLSGVTSAGFHSAIRFVGCIAPVAWPWEFCDFFLLSVLCSSVFKPNLEVKWLPNELC